MALDRFRKRRDEKLPERRDEELPEDARPGEEAGADTPPGADPQAAPRTDAQPSSGTDLIDAIARDRERLMNGELTSDEYRRRMTELLRDANPDEVAAASAGLSSTSEFSHVRASAEAGGFAPARGAAPMSVARTAAIERLTELRAAGKIDEESFLREKERLSRYGQ